MPATFSLSTDALNLFHKLSKYSSSSGLLGGVLSSGVLTEFASLSFNSFTIDSTCLGSASYSNPSLVHLTTLFGTRASFVDLAGTPDDVRAGLGEAPGEGDFSPKFCEARSRLYGQLR